MFFNAAQNRWQVLSDQKGYPFWEARENFPAGEAKADNDAQEDKSSAPQDSGPEGFERSSTENWLLNRGLSQFVDRFEANNLEINTLFDSSLDELFKVFEEIGLTPQENINLRNQITSDERWKGGLDDLFLLNLKNYTLVKELECQQNESSAVLRKILKAEEALEQTCDEYLTAVNACVEQLRTQTRERIENTRIAHQNKVVALTKAKRDIWSILANDNHGKNERINNVLLTIHDHLRCNLGGWSYRDLKTPEPDILQLKESVTKWLPNALVDPFEWDPLWISRGLRLERQGHRVIAPPAYYSYSGPMSVCGNVGWTSGVHRWDVEVSVSLDRQCRYERRVCPIIIGVCSERATWNQLLMGTFDVAGYCFDSGACVPRGQLLYGNQCLADPGQTEFTLELTLNLTARTLKINSRHDRPYMLMAVPEGKIYPWVRFLCPREERISCTIVK